MSMDISQFIELTADTNRRSELFDVFRDYLEDHQVEVACYHRVGHEPKIPPELGENLNFFSLPQTWIEHYRACDYYEIDPILEASKTTAEPFHLFEVDEILPLSEEQKKFLTELREMGLKDGLAVPVFGPSGDTAFFGLATWKAPLDLTESEVDELHLSCHQFHMRYCEINSGAEVDNDDKETALSPREREVLSWAAKGKSNSVIADILGISEHTVDTNIRRTFKKLGVNSRITAAVKAVGIGLISA